jgi:hypothetical protein
MASRYLSYGPTAKKQCSEFIVVSKTGCCLSKIEPS